MQRLYYCIMYNNVWYELYEEDLRDIKLLGRDRKKIEQMGECDKRL